MRELRSFALLAVLVCSVIATSGGASHQASAASPEGLVAAYSFDAGSGSSLADLSGNRNAGAISGATWTTAGKNGGALSFDGRNDLVSVADSASLDLTTGMTIEAWVKPAKLGGLWRTVVVKEQPNHLSYALYAHTTQSGPSGHAFVGGSDRYAIVPSRVPVNVWTHLAVTYDGSAVTMFVNGAFAASKAVSGPMAISNRPLQLGGNYVWSEWFSGLLDDVRIYKRALSGSEVRTDMGTAVEGASATAGSDSLAPSIPGSLQATSATNSAVSLSWSTATDNVGVAGYGVYRDGTGVSSTTTASYTYTGLSCGTTYVFAVDAYDAVGNRSGKASVSASTLACASGDPSKPVGLAKTGATQTSISFSWLPSSGDVGGYDTYHDWQWFDDLTGTSTTVTGLRCGTSYVLGVQSYNTAHTFHSAIATLSASTAACPAGDTQAPAVPTGLARTGSTASSVSLSWTSATDNVGVTGYGLYRDGASAGTSGSASTTITGLTCGTTYTFTVDAYDAAGNHSAKSAAVSASTDACAQAPLPPLPPPPAGSASVFVSPGGSDSNPCTQAAPCKSFDRAYHVAAPGSTVSVAAGNYGAQRFTSRGSVSADITFRAALDGNGNAADIVLSDLNIAGAQHLVLNGLNADGSYQNHWKVDGNTSVNNGSSDIGLWGLHFYTSSPLSDGNLVYTSNASNITIASGEIGPGKSSDGLDIWPGTNGIIVRGNHIHGIDAYASGDHTDAIQSYTGGNLNDQHIQIVGNVFDNNVNSNMHCDSETLNARITNNIVYDTISSPIVGPASFAMRCMGKGTVYAYNTFPGGQQIQTPANGYPQDQQYIGNLGTGVANCVGIFSRNVWTRAKCGTTDKQVSDRGISSDGRLTTTSPAINAGDPGNYPATDIDGHARPQGGAPDAGADERQ